jgi:hypothetical protein
VGKQGWHYKLNSSVNEECPHNRILGRVVVVRIEVLEESTASIIRVARSGGLGITLAVTCSYNADS